METEITKKNKLSSVWRWLLVLFIIIFSIVIILTGTALAMTYSYQEKIYPGIKIDDISLGGLTKTQASNIISGKFKTTYEKGFTFSFDNGQKTITDPDQKILSLNLESAINKAFEYGRSGAWWQNYIKVLSAPVISKKISLDYRLDKELLKEKLQAEFSSHEKPSKDASFVVEIKNEKNKEYELTVSPSTTGGITFNYDLAIEELENEIKNLNNPDIKLASKNDRPRITTEIAEELKIKFDELAAIDDIQFLYQDESWPIKWSDYIHWLQLGLNDSEKPTILLNKEMLDGQLKSIAQNINQDPVDAKLQIKDGRVTEFQASQNGQIVDVEESYKKINEELTINGNPSISLIVETKEPEITMDSTNDLGIKERIGYGWSDFSGSPANRRHNIGVGSASMHGVIVAPGEEFSLVKNLGPVDGEHGYLPELVIKENETIPEYGGGLCQVATTMFRAALDSGLKITQRRNHAYRVSYYEPAGTDATIYIPSPDVRFLNDTKHHILIQTKLWGNNLQFEIWGTDDGRTVSFEGQEVVDSIRNLKPKIFNVTAPGPAKEIPTTELAPGKKKQTESAHYGADTVFYRTVTLADGTEEKETWSSHYVPWQAVFLVGIDPEEKEKEAQEILEKQAEENASNEPLEETTTPETPTDSNVIELNNQ